MCPVRHPLSPSPHRRFQSSHCSCCLHSWSSRNWGSCPGLLCSAPGHPGVIPIPSRLSPNLLQSCNHFSTYFFPLLSTKCISPASRRRETMPRSFEQDTALSFSSTAAAPGSQPQASKLTSLLPLIYCCISFLLKKLSFFLLLRFPTLPHLQITFHNPFLCIESK